MNLKQMFLAGSVLAFACLRAWPEAADLKHSLDGKQGGTGYFDAHTHWPNGILPWPAFCKLLDGHQGQEDRDAIDTPVTPATPLPIRQRRLRMYEDLFATIKGLLTAASGPLAGVRGSRICPAAHAVVARPGPAITAAPGTPPWKQQFEARYAYLEDSLDMLLTTTPRTSYDSAYAIRGVLVDQFAGENFDKPGGPVLLGWLMAELARDGITYSEQSCNLRTAQACTPARLDAAYDGQPKPEVHFLVQFTQPMLSSVGPLKTDQWKYYRATDGREETGSANGLNSKNEALLEELERKPGAGNPLSLANVAGVDILSPERTIITDQGKENFQRLIRAVYQFTQRTGRRMLVRAHCGEGIPVEEEHGKSPQSLAQPEPAVKLDPRTRKPLHYQLARNNVSGLLDAVEAFRSSLPGDRAQADFDDHVNIRFGHVSHASREQAGRMATDQVWADVCLTSNLTTRTVVKLEDHSLAALEAEQVHVVLGTDGSGVEHSDMATEPGVARKVLEDTAKSGDPNIPKLDKNGRSLRDNAVKCVNRMLEDSISYANWMAGKPGTPARR